MAIPNSVLWSVAGVAGGLLLALNVATVGIEIFVLKRINSQSDTIRQLRLDVENLKVEQTDMAKLIEGRASQITAYVDGAFKNIDGQFDRVDSLLRGDTLISGETLKGRVPSREKTIPVKGGDNFVSLLVSAGNTGKEAEEIQSALVSNFVWTFRTGQSIRLLLEPALERGGALRPVRVTIYEGESAVGTVRRASNGKFVASNSP